MRRPLPLFSASLPSGLKMRSPKSALAGRQGTEQDAVGPCAVVAVADALDQRRRQFTAQIGRVDDDVVVAEAVVFGEGQGLDGVGSCGGDDAMDNSGMLSFRVQFAADSCHDILYGTFGLIRNLSSIAILAHAKAQMTANQGTALRPWHSLWLGVRWCFTDTWQDCSGLRRALPRAPSDHCDAAERRGWRRAQTLAADRGLRPNSSS